MNAFFLILETRERYSQLAISIQQSTEGSSQHNLTRNKRHSEFKRINKTICIYKHPDFVYKNTNSLKTIRNTKGIQQGCK